ncbi:MAG: hypothetical protein KGL02_08610 [Acidobacteriota bacterium]|nr:hypothetical protein [Acidobacteriota bacterium]MDE3169261.1 hypothetical protein [Acidobacteriota bacterium]
MNDFQDENEKVEGAESSGVSGASIWPGVVIVALILVAGLAIVYAHSQRSQINAITSRDASLNTSVAQLQDQLQSTTTKLNEMVAQQQAAAQAAAEAAQAKQQAAAEHRAVRTGRTAAHRGRVGSASEKRYNALAARVDAQQKELDETNQSIAKTRSDLQASLDSTASGLNGSIAKNHAELVALEKRGQRSFFEFDLSKEKQFSHAGPISLSLRHADTKHQRYNMMLLVDDNRLEKKNVDLYEPIWISSSDAPQPVEIVVNKITKNHIHGYVSAPKFSNAELNTDATLQPVSATSSNASDAPVAGTAQPAATPTVQP